MIEAINDRYLALSRRIRVWSARNVSWSAQGMTTERFQQTLRVLVQRADRCAIVRRTAAVERELRPLARVDRGGLIGSFVDANDKAAIGQFRIWMF